MTYSVKEIYKTLQGEGGQAGRAAVFCRFAGCNLWSGREQDRATATCTFCDTDFVGTNGPGGGTFSNADQLADAIMRKWKVDDERKLVVFTGGEPLLQLDDKLINAMHNRHFQIAVETNGTITAPPGIDWICVSPKAGTRPSKNSARSLNWSIRKPIPIRPILNCSISSISFCSRWMGRSVTKTPPPPWPIASTTRAGA